MSADISAGSWIKGIVLSVLASVIGGASKLAIRKSWLMVAHLSSETETHPVLDAEDGDVVAGQLQEQSSRDDSNKRINALAWTLRLSGMFGMTILNPLCCVLAMNYASPSILAPFSGLTLVWIVLFSNVLIGERPGTAQVVAASLIVLGEVVVAIFGDHTNDEGVTLEDLEESYRNPLFVGYFVAITLWMCLLWYWMRCARRGFFLRFAWGVSGGSITGLQNFLKDSLTILKASHGRRYPWYLMVTGALAILTAFSGLLFLTACMKRYDATYSAAMFVGSFVVSASIMSAVHYNTFANLESIWSYVLYPAGLVILMGGVFILVRHTKEAHQHQRVVRPTDESGYSVIESSLPSSKSFTLDEPLVTAENNDHGIAT